MRHFFPFVSVVLLLSVVSDSRAVTSPNYQASPVFYEKFVDHYADERNLESLPKGVVRLAPIGTENVDRFDWVRHQRQDKSFWQRMEECVYLLPLITSDDPAHLDFAGQWFNAWYAAHARNQQPNVGAWDGMTSGRRAMVFVTLLRRVEQQPQADAATIEQLKNAIGLHQQWLADPKNYESLSNHGMWQAMGLYETTRVLPNDELAAVALDRLLQLTSRSVSSQGTHLEHSPAYHFYFLTWLSDFSVYLNGLGDIGWENLAVLSDIERAMKSASYYMYDHEGNLPQIGDTDATTLDDHADYQSDGRAIFDPEAGFAVFKDRPDALTKRYVVMRVQNQHYQPQFRHHCHNDVLSVYYARDGEVILSDQGRFSYDRTATRGYVMSLAAHNTILPSSMIVPTQPGIYVCEEVWAKTDDWPVQFGAHLVNEVVSRRVVIPRSEGRILIDDTIQAGDEFLMLWYIGADVAQIRPGTSSAVDDWRYYEWSLTTKKGAKLRLQIGVNGDNTSRNEEVSLIKGQQQPFLGWQSPGYKKLEPVPVVTLLLRPKDVINVTTEVRDDNQ